MTMIFFYLTFDFVNGYKKFSWFLHVKQTVVKYKCTCDIDSYSRLGRRRRFLQVFPKGEFLIFPHFPYVLCFKYVSSTWLDMWLVICCLYHQIIFFLSWSLDKPCFDLSVIKIICESLYMFVFLSQARRSCTWLCLRSSEQHWHQLS